MNGEAVASEMETNSMSKKFWMAAMAGMLGVATLGMAQGPHRGFAAGAHDGQHDGAAHGSGAHRGTPQIEALKTYLGLSDTQVASLQQARTDAFEQAKPSLKDGAQKARDLRAEMNKANPDSNTVGRLMTEMKQMREQGRSTQTQVREKSMAVLTEPQKTKLKALEDAAALQDAVREARMSGLLNAPVATTDGGAAVPMTRGRGFRPQR